MAAELSLIPSKIEIHVDFELYLDLGIDTDTYRLSNWSPHQSDSKRE